MPISTTPTPGQRTWKVSIVGPDNVEFTIEAYTTMSTEAQADDVTQSLVNHLAQWPDLVSLGVAQKQTLQTYAITPDE